ncbi:hypothetical protein [Adhaeribacter radiodurans]|uniref:T9SS type A sorting domain-containing protein n=1 Tax=Adhaeribacter radiodurans TaxID=2745197 RepID=A0A7L7LE36_9BACT|nr:hypothetical protein [Adhaeribacter radiodurans]QMU31033.1 hypothetical protein HUW48_24760 [Adhaeribacter radiodurans]
MKVYDSQGREITTLFQGEAKTHQKYKAKLQAPNKAAGLHFLQLQTPRQRYQQGLVLNK